MFTTKSHLDDQLEKFTVNSTHLSKKCKIFARKSSTLVLPLIFSSFGHTAWLDEKSLEDEACPAFENIYDSWAPPKYHWTCIQNFGSCYTKELYKESCEVTKLEDAAIRFEIHYDRLVTGWAGDVRDNEDLVVYCLIDAQTYNWSCNYSYLYMESGLANGSELQRYQGLILDSLEASINKLEQN